MGIKNLNRFLISHSSDNSIFKIGLSHLKGKRIAIDTSIYLYRYAIDNKIMKNFFNMLVFFKEQDIRPIFVFDGKPPEEKKDVLEMRREKKRIAKKMYDELESTLESETDQQKIRELNQQMATLKKHFIHIRNKDIDDLKKLLTAFGASYVDAEGEADELCVWLQKSKKVWACMSDDMDMFAFGCMRVIRDFNIYKRECVMYDMSKILVDLGISMRDFKQICIMSGTDYSTKKSRMGLGGVLSLYEKYRNHKTASQTVSFMEWVCSHVGGYQTTDLAELQHIYTMFSTGDSRFSQFKNVYIHTFIEKNIDWATIQLLLSPVTTTVINTNESDIQVQV